MLIFALILCFTIPAFAVKILPYACTLHDVMHWDAKSATLVLKNPEGETLTASWPSTVDLWNYDGSTWKFDLPTGNNFAFNKIVNVALTSGLVTGGAVRSMVLSQTLTADCPAPAYHEVLNVSLYSQFTVGNWANAIMAKIVFDPTGDAKTGMASVIATEMYLPNKTTAGGSYYNYEANMIAPTNWLAGGLPLTQVVAFNYFNVAGAGVGALNDHAVLFHLMGCESATGHLLYTHAVTTPGAAAGSLKINIAGTNYYLYFWAAQGAS